MNSCETTPATRPPVPDTGTAGWSPVARLDHWLAAVMPPGIGRHIGNVVPPDFALTDEELACSKSFSAKRMSDFVAGRHSAVEALRSIGHPREPILIGTSRQPIWPAAIVGSIAHTKGVAAAIAAPGRTHSGLGIDLEYLKPLHDLAEHICTPDELAFAQEHPCIPDYLNVLFSAKEAVYKCLWPLAGRFISFHEVELAIDCAGRSFRIAWHDNVHPVAGRVHGFWATAADMIAAVAVLDRH